MAYYECIYNNDCINNDDSFIVTLTGSHNVTISASVCYIDKTTICLLGNTSLGNANCPTQLGYAWNYNVNINNKEYTGTCRIPTLTQISSKCARYKRDFRYWTSTPYSTSITHFHYVTTSGIVYFEHYNNMGAMGTLPFIEITL